MAVKKKDEYAFNPKNLELLHEAIDAMIDNHADEIEEAIEGSEDRCLTINIPVNIDCSESAPNIDVGFRFSTAVTDRRSIRCDDPKQPPLLLTPEEEAKMEERKKKDAEKAKKAEEKAAEKAAKGLKKLESIAEPKKQDDWD